MIQSYRRSTLKSTSKSQEKDRAKGVAKMRRSLKTNLPTLELIPTKTYICHSKDQETNRSVQSDNPRLGSKQNVYKSSKYKQYVKTLQNENLEKYVKNNQQYQCLRIKTINTNENQTQTTQKGSKIHHFIETSEIVQSSSDSEISNEEKINIQAIINEGPGKRSNVKRITRKMSIIQTNNELRRRSHELPKNSIFDTCCKKFEESLELYRKNVKDSCQQNDVKFEDVNCYPRDLISFVLHGDCNEINFVRESMRTRWWWSQQLSEVVQVEKETKQEFKNMNWSQRWGVESEKYFKKQKKLKNRIYKSKQSIKISTVTLQWQDCQEQKLQRIRQNKIHNHLSKQNIMKQLILGDVFAKKYINNSQMHSMPTFCIQKIGDQQWEIFIDAFQFYKTSISANTQNNNIWNVKIDNGESVALKQLYDIEREVMRQLKNNPFVFIQKELQNHFQLFHRKFTINCFVLVTRLCTKSKIYLFREGLIDFTDGNRGNKPQTLKRRKSRFQTLKQQKPLFEGIIDFQSFQTFLQLLNGNKYNLIEQIIPKIKTITDRIFSFFNQLIQPNDNRPSYQIFQIQFTLDESFNPYFVFVQPITDHWLDLNVVNKILNLVYEHAFRLTIDLLFPPPSMWPTIRRHLLPYQIHQNSYELISEQSFCLIFHNSKTGQLQINNSISAMQAFPAFAYESFSEFNKQTNSQHYK